MFDEIYWNFIDSKFVGPFTTIGDRLCLLSTGERVNIDICIEKKMHQASESKLLSHYSIGKLVEL